MTCQFTPLPQPEGTISHETSCPVSLRCTLNPVSSLVIRNFYFRILTRPHLPVYANIGKKHPQAWASTILAIVSIFVTTPIYVGKHLVCCTTHELMIPSETVLLSSWGENQAE